MVMVDPSMDLGDFDSGGGGGSNGGIDGGGAAGGGGRDMYYNLPIRKELQRINTLPPNDHQPVNISVSSDLFSMLPILFLASRLLLNKLVKKSHSACNS